VGVPAQRLKARLYFDGSGVLRVVAVRNGILRFELVWLEYMGFEYMDAATTVYDTFGDIVVEVWSKVSYDTGGLYMDRILTLLERADGYELEVMEGRS